jgi:hypothetical protein
MSIEKMREELLAIREREIMQNRIAATMSKGKGFHARPLTYTEKLALRLRINKTLPKGKP